jgi:hypothetical protein
MPKVLIATRFMSWGAIALSVCSCNANSQSKLDPQRTPAGVQQTATSTSGDLPRSTPIITSSPTTSPTPQIVTAKPAALVEVPYVNPLNAIPLAAKQQIANDVKSPTKTADKSATSANASSKIDPDTNAIMPSADRLARQLSRQPSSNSNPLSASCRAFPCLILSQDADRLNRFNNPIYKLTAYRDRTSNYSFQLDAVTGRNFTQSRNRYQSNTEAPLPDGSYSVAARVVKGNIAEVGGTMIPIFPKSGFDPRMRRTALGIHWDPSFNKDAKEDGTSGCIGLTNKSSYYQVRNFILKYRPRDLEVQIDR